MPIVSISFCLNVEFSVTMLFPSLLSLPSYHCNMKPCLTAYTPFRLPKFSLSPFISRLYLRLAVL